MSPLAPLAAAPRFDLAVLDEIAPVPPLAMVKGLPSVKLPKVTEEVVAML